jgi:HEAT repeat protein
MKMKKQEKYKYFNRYFNALIKDFESIRDISAIGQRTSIDLEEIYVPQKLRVIYRTQDLAIENERMIDPVTAVKNYQHMVILGVPGAGKTTMLKHLAQNHCRENIEKQEHAWVPIPITLRKLSESGKGLRDYIDAVFETYGFAKAKKYVEKELKAGKCILLLDGFDEVTTRKNQEKVTKEIHAFHKKYHECKLVVFSRFTGSHDDLTHCPGNPFMDFTRLEVTTFNNTQVSRFIDNWFGAFNRGKADSMLRMIMNNKDIETLARNPLIISIIAALYDEENERLPKRADLYERLIDVMLDKWDAHKMVRNQFSPDKKKFILRKLAFRNHCSSQQTITGAEILEEIARHSSWIGLKKEEFRLFLEEICQRNFILRQLSMDTYDFFHLSFQEYFTALELKEQENMIPTIIPKLPESWWEEPFLLYAGISQNASPVIKRIQKEMPEDIFYSSLMLSGKCIVDAGFTDPSLKKEITQALWLLYNTGEFPLLREKAIKVLSQVKPRSIIDDLVNQLTDKEPHTRRIAAETLGLIGSAEVLPALIMILVKDKESKIRSHAAVALGQIGSAEAVLPLINALNIDKESEVRKSAAEALGLIGRPEALPALIKALMMDKDNSVRGEAAEAPGKIESPEAIPQLIQALDAEKVSSVRWRIVKSLGKCGGIEAHNVRDILMELLATDKDKEVRESAAEALGFIGGADSITALIKALSSDENADVRGSAAYTLGFIKSEEALPVLIKALITDPNGEVRGRAAYALGRIKNIEALPYLTAVFNAHKESLIRGNATYALGEIGGVGAIPFLIQVLTFDKDSYVRYRAAEVLGSIGNITTIEPLKTALKDDGSYYGWKVKDKAFEALEKISRRLRVRILSDS